MEQATRQLKLEVAYARADQQVLAEVQVPEGATVREAIEASRVLSRFPEIDLEKSKVGVYGKVVPLDTVVKNGDRVEIYRALIGDPKEIRKLRAAEGKKMKRGVKVRCLVSKKHYLMVRPLSYLMWWYCVNKMQILLSFALAHLKPKPPLLLKCMTMYRPISGYKRRFTKKIKNHKQLRNNQKPVNLEVTLLLNSPTKKPLIHIKGFFYAKRY